jgi:tRNA (Thr-GGU) A37 N-methylase
VIQLKPVGICRAPLLEVRGNVLRVRGLEVLGGMPAFDPKPYFERGNVIIGTRLGVWIRQYWATR